MTSPTRHVSLYRASLRLYPRSFRRDYGEPMQQLFADRVRDVGSRAWLRVVPDLALSVPQQRIEALMSERSPAVRVLAIVGLVALAVVATLGMGGPGVVPVVLIAVIALVYSQRHLFASAFGSDRIPLRRALVQAWWAPVAAVVAAGEIWLGVSNVFTASNWGGRTFGAVIPTLIGIGVLYALTRRPFARASSNGLILLATVPGFLFFWAIVPPLLSLVVWIGVLSSGFEAKPAVATLR